MAEDDGTQVDRKLAELPGAFRFSQALAMGVTESRLRGWLANGLINRSGRGIFLRADVEVADPDRLEVALRASRATICLVSALVEHDLVDDNPGVLDLALPRGAWHPQLEFPVRWHSFASATFDLDRCVVSAGGDVAIGLYGPRRSIVDAFRLRHDVGPEVGVEALKRWLGRKGNNPGELLTLASNFPVVLPSLTAALQVLL